MHDLRFAICHRDAEGRQGGRRERQDEPEETTKRTVDLGTTTVTLKAGESQKVTVKLNGAGQGLLKSHHTLAVKLTVHSGASVLVGPTITFKAPTSKAQAKKH